MDADTLDALDNFINDASDQAAAWYSIVQNKPVAIPSAQIQAQQNVANLPATAGNVITPIGSVSLGGVNGTLVLVVGVAIIGYLLLK